jgi:hypothetical protein
MILRKRGDTGTLWRTRFGRGYEPVIRQSTEWMVRINIQYSEAELLRVAEKQNYSICKCRNTLAFQFALTDNPALGIPVMEHCLWRQNHDPNGTADSFHVLDDTASLSTRIFHFLSRSFTEPEPTSGTSKVSSWLSLRNQILQSDVTVGVCFGIVCTTYVIWTI